MKNLKLLIASLVSVLTINAANADDMNKIRIGVEAAYPPFSEMGPDGEVQGFDIDIAKALCEQMQAQCELIVNDFDALIPGLRARKHDAIIASMSITEERKKVVAFSNKYYATPAKFVAPKESDFEISNEGLAGKNIAVQTSTIHDTFLSDQFPEANIKRYTDLEDAYLDALNGRVDLILADSVPLSIGFLQSEKGVGWEFIGPDYTDPKFFGEGVGVAIAKNNQELVDAVNAAIDAIRENGVYDEIASKYFDFNIYGD